VAEAEAKGGRGHGTQLREKERSSADEREMCGHAHSISGSLDLVHGSGL